jgi:tRNA(Ile)-lysidine synthase
MSTPASSAERVVLDALGAAVRALPHETAGAPVALAYSGGLDSCVLLDAAVRVLGAERCVALHVHHGLSAAADAWLSHCEATARKLGVRFEAARVELQARDELGVEASAREARYAALETLCVKYSAQTLWLAQHADDQAETVLLQLLRGAGVAGMAAMAPAYRPGSGEVLRLRPFLALQRTQLEAYAAARGLQWVEDESNADTRFARNALRLDVLPALATHFPGYREALARTAQHAAAAQVLLDQLAEGDWQQARLDQGRSLSRASLLTLDDARGANLLRYWMRVCGLPGASAARLGNMMRQLREAGATHALRIAHAGYELRLYRDAVQWVEASSDANGDGDFMETSADELHSPLDVSAALPERLLVWQGEEVWRVPGWRGSFVFAPCEAGAADGVPESLLRAAPLLARARRGGERLRPHLAGPSRSLKNLYQEQGVPVWLRDGPLLYAGAQLVFVAWLGANRGELPAAAEGAWRRIEWRPDLQIA